MGRFSSSGRCWPGTSPVIIRRAAGDAGPEFGDFGDVFGPVVDLGEEDGADIALLADICVEVMEEFGNAGFSAEAVEQR